MACNMPVPYRQAIDQLRMGGPAAGGPGGAQPYPAGAFAGQPYGCPDDCIGDHFYGFVQTAIAAAGTATITVQPQRRNQPRRLFLTETVADNFLINDIFVGRDTVLATSGAISAAIFIQNSECPDFRRLICEVSQQVSVLVTSVSGAAATFAATMSAYMLA